MKRIELVIKPAALDSFTETAAGLNLSDFDVTEVRRTISSSSRERQRLYRAREVVVDLVERLKVDLNVTDDAAPKVAHQLIVSVRPESIAIMKLDNAAAVAAEAPVPTSGTTGVPSRPGLIATH
jgi:nitrogen regulatory protein PII